MLTKTKKDYSLQSEPKKKKKKKVGGEQDEGQKVCSEQIESAPVSDARVQVHAEG